MRVERFWNLRASGGVWVWLVVASASACGPGTDAPPERPKVALGKPSNAIDPVLIGEAVRSRAGQFQRCYLAAQEYNPGLQGQVEVRFLVNRDGSIGQAMVAETDLPSQVTNCVIDAFYGVRLPQQESAVIEQYPLYFHPS